MPYLYYRTRTILTKLSVPAYFKWLIYQYTIHEKIIQKTLSNMSCCFYLLCCIFVMIVNVSLRAILRHFLHVPYMDFFTFYSEQKVSNKDIGRDTSEFWFVTSVSFGGDMHFLKNKGPFTNYIVRIFDPLLCL